MPQVPVGSPAPWVIPWSDIQMDKQALGSGGTALRRSGPSVAGPDGASGSDVLPRRIRHRIQGHVAACARRDQGAQPELNRLGFASLRPDAPQVQVIKAPAGKMLSKAAQQALLQEAQIHFRLKHPR